MQIAYLYNLDITGTWSQTNNKVCVYVREREKEKGECLYRYIRIQKDD